MKLRTGDLASVRQKIKEKQGNTCAICKGSFDEGTYHSVKKKVVPKYTACLDHNHDTGVVRGVLCSYCNAVEGKTINAIKRWHREIKGDPEKISQFLHGLAIYYALHTNTPSNLIHPNHKTEDEKRLLRNKRARKRRKSESK